MALCLPSGVILRRPLLRDWQLVGFRPLIRPSGRARVAEDRSTSSSPPKTVRNHLPLQKTRDRIVSGLWDRWPFFGLLRSALFLLTSPSFPWVMSSFLSGWISGAGLRRIFVNVDVFKAATLASTVTGYLPRARISSTSRRQLSRGSRQSPRSSWKASSTLPCFAHSRHRRASQPNTFAACAVDMISGPPAAISRARSKSTLRQVIVMGSLSRSHPRAARKSMDSCIRFLLVRSGQWLHRYRGVSRSKSGLTAPSRASSVRGCIGSPKEFRGRAHRPYDESWRNAQLPLVERAAFFRIA